MILFQGIEALEYYIDPSAEAQVEEKKPEETVSGTATGSTPGMTPTVSPGQPPGQPVAPVSPDQPAVFCQKGDFFLLLLFYTYCLSQENATHMTQAK